MICFLLEDTRFCRILNEKLCIREPANLHVKLSAIPPSNRTIVIINHKQVHTSDQGQLSCQRIARYKGDARTVARRGSAIANHKQSLMRAIRRREIPDDPCSQPYVCRTTTYDEKGK